MEKTLQNLVCIFQPDGFDWMNFTLSKSNPYTYHHILERNNGGERSVDNGAILTKKAHRFLNLLQMVYPDAYDDLQDVFRRINASKQPMVQEYIDEIDEILRKVLITKEYKFKPFKNFVDKGNTTEIVSKDDSDDLLDNDLIWTSSNPDIAIVKDGIITGIKPGTVNITARTKNGQVVFDGPMRVIDISSHCKTYYKSNRKIK